ncbi:MAG: hypothetical protein WBZ32_16435, partial [Candidatus Acidiferrales bacterium]
VTGGEVPGGVLVIERNWKFFSHGCGASSWVIVLTQRGDTRALPVPRQNTETRGAAQIWRELAPGAIRFLRLC